MKSRSLGKAFPPFAAALAAVMCLVLPLQAQVLSKLSSVRTRAGSRPPSVALSLPADVAIVATNSVDLRKFAEVTGDVVVNVDTGEPPPIALKADDVSVSGDLKAASISLANGASVGNVCVDFLTNNGGTINGATGPYSSAGAAPCDDTPPIFNPLPHFNIARPGTADVVVPSNGTMTIGAGRVRNILVNKNATLFVTGGLVEAASVTLLSGAKLLFQSASEVRIAGRLDVQKAGTIGPATGSGIFARNIVVYVEGENANSNPPMSAAVVGENGAGGANFYVPNGTFNLGKGAAMTGAVIARDVIVETSATLAVDSFFVNQPPTADAQSVQTNGAAALDIILTGSDPEGEDLMFAIVTPPVASIGNITAGPTPIIPPPPPNRCAVSGAVCTTNADCPGGETCDPSGPAAPITSATVTYTPVNAGANAENSFTFQVADPLGLTGAAVVSINNINDTSPPPPAPTAVDAPDIFADTATDTPVTIGLTAGGCPGSSLQLEVLSLPANGTLSEGGVDIESVPHTLLGTSVVFTPAAGFNGNTSFDHRATDTAAACTTTSDTGTVFITVAPAPALAGPDQTLTTKQNTPVQITLSGNPGGTGTSGSPLKAARVAAGLPVANAPLPGATMAGNVSDANDDGLGDGKDNLPGSTPILIAAGVDVNLGSSTVDLFSDLAGWQSAVGGGVSVQDFEGFTAGASVEGAAILPGVILSSNFGSFTVFVTSPDNAVFGFDGTTRVNGEGYYQLDFSQTYNAVSFVVESWDPAAGGPAVVEVTLSNGAVVSHNVSKTTGTEDDPVFIGLRSPTYPITRVRFNEPPETGGSSNEETVLDDISVANNAVGIHGVVRTQIEWDVTSLPIDPDDIESCAVTLITNRGSVDSLDTSFFAGTANQNGTLDLTDFEVPVGATPLVVMPVSIGVNGSDVPFSFDVTGAVKSARGGGFSFFSISGRVNETLADGMPDVTVLRGLQIYSTASGNLSAGKQPKLTCLTTGTPTGPQLTWRILTVPTTGLLLDPSGNQLFGNETFTIRPTLTFVSPTAGTFGFSYRVTEGGLFDEAVVTLVVQAGDDCLINGRDPGCSP